MGAPRKRSRSASFRRRSRLARMNGPTWHEPKGCKHTWSVFNALKDNRSWAYCTQCGALHPGEQ